MRLVSSLDRLCRGLTYLGAAALSVMMLATAIDVVMRSVANQPIRGIVDLVEIMVLLVVFLGLPEAFRRDEQITVDLIDKLVPPAVLKVVRTAAAAASTFFLYLIGANLIQPLIDTYRFGDRKPDLGVPLYPFLAVVAFCIAVSLVAMIAITLREALHKLPRGEA